MVSSELYGPYQDRTTKETDYMRKGYTCGPIRRVVEVQKQVFSRRVTQDGTIKTLLKEYES